MTDTPNDEITLREAAKLLKIEPYTIQTAEGELQDLDEATAVLEAMLAAGRAGKTVRG